MNIMPRQEEMFVASQMAERLGGNLRLMEMILERRNMFSPDISRVGCAHMQGIRAADVVVYLKALITQQMSAPGSPEG